MADERPPQDSNEQFAAWFRGWFSQEVMPLLKRHFEEIVETKLGESRAALPAGKGADVKGVADQVAALLKGPLSEDVQRVVDHFDGRVKALEQGGRQVAVPTGTGATMAQEAGDRTLGAKAANWVAVGESLIDVFVGKILPAMVQMRNMSSSSVYDLNWAANLRAADPIKATILANQLNPDPLAAQLPMITANIAQSVGSASYARGLGTKVQTLQMLAGGQWPWTPSPGLPGYSGSPLPAPTAPAGGQSQPKTGASMSNRRQSGAGRQPTNAGSAAAPRKLGDLFR